MDSGYLTYQALQRRLAHLAARRGSRAPDDAASEAILRVFRHPVFGPALAVYADEDAAARALEVQGKQFADLTNFLVTVLRNLVIDELRGRQRHQEVADAAADGGADPTMGPEALAIHQQQLARVRGCIAALREPYLRAVRLYLGGLTGREVAARLGEDPARVNNWIHRGLKQVARCTQGRG